MSNSSNGLIVTVIKNICNIKSVKWDLGFPSKTQKFIIEK